MHITVQERCTGSAQELYNWWTDYTEGEIEATRSIRVTRRIVSKEERKLLLEDRFRRPVPFTDITEVELLPEERKVRFHSRSSMWESNGIYTFSGDNECTATLELDLKPRGLLRLFLLLPHGKRWFLRQFIDDLKAHLSEFERERNARN